MSKRRDTRRLAMQILYQFDVRGEADMDAVRQALDDEFDSLDVRDAAFDLAVKAWSTRQTCDELATELAPDWPTHRQPPVDRSIIRLAYYEIISGHAPLVVAINEAVQLAKDYAAEDAPKFVNAVLDKISKRIESQTETEDEKVMEKPTEEAWLSDAIKKEE